MKNVILIGFMGSGKSSIGRYFASHYHMTQIDTDQYIEEQSKRKISDIFATEGEEYFREMETDVLRELLTKQLDHIVLSVGGGLPMRPVNEELLHRFGTVIYLKTDVDTLVERLSHDQTRPLLQGGNIREKIETLMAKREATYERVADYAITTTGKNFYEISQDILLAMDGEV